MKRRLTMIFVLIMILSGCQTKEAIVEPKDDPIIEEPVEEPVEEVKFRSVFNGLPVDEGTKYQAVAIMIENSAAARPHSGIGLADVVYEIAVDGWQITRFLAIFQSEFPAKVGPVRSARLPFVKIQLEWMLPFAHYGSAETGVGNAYAIIRKTDWPVRFDGVSGLNDDFFSRDNSRIAPHNAYFDSNAALAKIPELNFDRRFLFDDNPLISVVKRNILSLEYSSTYKIQYNYDETDKKYLRFINEKPMMDTYMDSQVAVTNIILLHAPHTSAEIYEYVLVDFISTGKAEYFINGNYIEGKWIKSTDKDITRYVDLEGNEIKFLPGNTWIQVVSERVKISHQ